MQRSAVQRRTARAEIVRCWDEIARRMRGGETACAIYDDLSADERVRMSERTFQRWVARFSREQPFEMTDSSDEPANAVDDAVSASGPKAGPTTKPSNRRRSGCVVQRMTELSGESLRHKRPSIEGGIPSDT